MPDYEKQPDQGHLVIFLHAHLPFVRHPEHEEFLEEDWLFEAITETYLPLLSLAEKWHEERLAARLTFSITPPLLEMLRDDLLMRRCARRIERLLAFAESEVRRNANDERFRFTAEMYRDRFADALERFERRYSRDLVAAFKALQDCGILEIPTSCATHAYLPCFGPTYVRAQIRLGIKTYKEHFGHAPPGFWLPECGFVPGIDRILADEGVNYFLVDSHAVEFAEPPAVLGTYSPVVCPSAVFAFPRDRESSAQVWSSESGYPGDGRYREFYRDIGYDLDDASSATFRLPNGAKKNLGIKYYRVTGRDVGLDDKQPYHRGWALEAAAEHAEQFVAGRQMQIDHWRNLLARPPVVVAPYDAELFGHWWFEGPEFIDLVVRKIAQNDRGYRLSTPTDVMNSGLQFQVTMPAASSWGAYGYSDSWLNSKNEWVWRHLHRAAREMAKVASDQGNADALEQRAKNQLARELVLATSSDWPFIMTMGTTVPYAERRIREHINRFNRLLGQVRTHTIDENWLVEIERCDNLFRNIDFREFAAPSQ